MIGDDVGYVGHWIDDTLHPAFKIVQSARRNISLQCQIIGSLLLNTTYQAAKFDQDTTS